MKYFLCVYKLHLFLFFAGDLLA